MYSISYVYFSAFAKTVAVGTVILCMLRENVQEYQKMIREGFIYVCYIVCISRKRLVLLYLCMDIVAPILFLTSHRSSSRLT